jgi:hypothetical protein
LHDFVLFFSNAPNEVFMSRAGEQPGGLPATTERNAKSKSAKSKSAKSRTAKSKGAKGKS